MAGREKLAGSQEEEVGAGSAQEVEAVLGLSEGDGPLVLRLQRRNCSHRGQHTPTHTRYVPYNNTYRVHTKTLNVEWTTAV